jgi:hypothetical protein
MLKLWDARGMLFRAKSAKDAKIEFGKNWRERGLCELSVLGAKEFFDFSSEQKGFNKDYGIRKAGSERSDKVRHLRLDRSQPACAV